MILRVDIYNPYNMWLRGHLVDGRTLMGNWHWDYKLYIVELYHLEREMAQLPRHTCLLKEPLREKNQHVDPRVYVQVP